jgi:hypothetical protein
MSVRAQILGVDSLRTKDVRATHRLVLAHIARVRAIPDLHDCTIVFSLESNLAFEAQVTNAALRCSRACLAAPASLPAQPDDPLFSTSFTPSIKPV